MKKLGAIILVCSCVLAMMVGCTTKQGKDSFKVNEKITILNREEGSGTRMSFLDILELQESEVVKDQDNVVSGTDVMLSAVESELYSIGYVSKSSLTEKVKVLTVEGVSPTKETISKGEYPFTRSLSLATKGEGSEVLQDFLEFLKTQSEKIEGFGYIPAHNNAAYTSSQPSGSIKISGSSSVYPLLNELVEIYKTVNAKAEIEINQTDSTNGIESVKNGISDMAMVSRRITKEEQTSLKVLNLANDAIAVIVNENNPTDNISVEALRRIYTGKAHTWDSVK